MLLQAATLQKIVTKNLFTVSIAETQIASNFQLILQALTDYDKSIGTHTQKIDNLEKIFKENTESQKAFINKTEKCEEELQKGQETANKDIKELQQKIKRLEMALGSVEQSSRVNPEVEKEQEELAKIVRLLQQRMNTAEAKIQNVELKTAEIDVLADNLKKQQIKIINLEDELAKLKAELKSLKNEKSNKGKEANQDYLKSLAEDIQSLRNDLDKISAQLKGEMNQIKDNHLNKLKEGQENINRQHKKMTDQIWKFNEQLYNIDKHSQQVETAHNKSIEDILRRLKELQDLMAKMKNEKSTISTTLSPQSARPETYATISHEEKKSKKDADMEDSANFRQQMLERMKQQRADVNKAIKKLDRVSSKKQQDHEKFSELEDQILKLAHLLEGKVDEDGLKKWMKYVDNQLKIIFRIVNVQSEQDAYIAKKNWFCLSCDRKLQPYKGKIGHHLAGGQIRGKAIDHEIIGGGMLFRNRSKFELPQCKK